VNGVKPGNEMSVAVRSLIGFGYDPILLRSYLFLGLLIHKLVWEVLKRRNQRSPISQKIEKRAILKLIKLTKVLILSFLVVQTLFLIVFPIMDHPAPLELLGTVLFTLGLSIAIIGRLNLGKNWVDLEDYQALPGQSVVTRGIYRYIRHPIYAGDVLLMLGLELALNSWLVLGVVFLILVVIKQVLAEETLLSVTFPDYDAYRARTKKFIPFIY
jgi:protein-S-isoprenylcysteine O-methyltransferase Ste14